MTVGRRTERNETRSMRHTAILALAASQAAAGWAAPAAADSAGKVATAGCGGTRASAPGVLNGQEHVQFVAG